VASGPLRHPLQELFLDQAHLHVGVPSVGLVSSSRPATGRRARRGSGEGVLRQETATGALSGPAECPLRPSNLPDCCQPDRNGQKLLDTAFERLVSRDADFYDLSGRLVLRSPPIGSIGYSVVAGAVVAVVEAGGGRGRLVQALWERWKGAGGRAGIGANLAAILFT
jgi:hypothetical protein